jgi:hypothetical protein
MARHNTTQLTYQAIRIAGGLIPADELARLTTLQTPEQTEQKDAQYGIPKGLKLRDEVARFWKIAQNLWSDFQPLRQRQDVDAHRATVQEFLIPLLRDVLGYTDLAPGAMVEVSGHTYNLGYATRGGRLPAILAAHTQALDAATERFGELNPDTGKIHRRSPFMLAQEALNASDAALWAITSNGLVLRVLRDNPSLTRPVYVEIDIEVIFSEDLYADFTAFWLLAHASRFGKPDAEPVDCPWERWRAAGQETGVTLRSNLRYQVAEALRALGTGFLSHPANTHLRGQLQHQEQAEGLGKQVFFEELLGLVYRLIFLSTVEDRIDPASGQPLIFTPGTPPAVRQRYLSGYSLTWLRERAVRRSSFDTHGDLWQALSITFDALAHGQSALGLPALGGLFDADQCPHLSSAHIENRWLLAAVFQLGYFRQASSLTRVNYRDMGPEELGSVYESLLELVPDVQNLGQPHAAKLAFVGDDDTNASTRGNTRKLTGSYYTPDSLVQELIKSALEPVITETVKAHPERPVDALLQLTVCDPACGSGHFLLAAARRIADEVAKLRAAQSGVETDAAMVTEPLGEQQAYRHALRDVVSHCIYGVDKNPMAIALAKTALWLEAYTPDRPLTFLDHHLQVGDALLGVLDPKILENGIPDAAYAALSGDDKVTAAALKKQNKADLKSWKEVAASDLFQSSGLAAQADEVEHLTDDNLQGIAAKRSAWTRTSAEARHSTLARLADTYVAAFLAPKVPESSSNIPLSGYLWGLLHPAPGHTPKADVAEAAYHLCRIHSVFHWWLAFPQVAAKGGFAVMLGNPPWEQLQLSEEEFFASRAPSIAAMAGAKRKAAITALETEAPWLWTQLQAARRQNDAANLFFRAGGRFPLSAHGKLDTYPLFSETFLQATHPNGRSGFIVKAGIATDDSNKFFFAAVVERQRLVSLLGFDNAERIFPAVHPDTPFVLVTLGAATSPTQLLHYALRVEHLQDPRRRFSLTRDEFALINPNTRTCPVFRSERDSELTKKLYRAAPVLIQEAGTDAEGNVLRPEVNPWSITFSQGLFNMTSASELFKKNAAREGEFFRLPLYEGKLIHQFDHRWATFVPDSAVENDDWLSRDVTLTEKSDSAYRVTTRYWVEEGQVLARIARVPSRVANAWLAWHAATPGTAQQDAEGAVLLALAGWVAGALFRQAADASAPAAPGSASLWEAPASPTSPAPQSWTSQQRQHGLLATERTLAQHYPAFNRVLKAVYITSTQLLGALTKWAQQDDLTQGMSLSDAELVELQNLQQPVLAAGDAFESGATDAHQISVGGRFCLEFLDAWMDRRSPRWLIGWRDITNATNERTVIASVVPRAGVGNNMPLMLFSPVIRAAQCAVLLGNLDSLVLDFVARHKVGGTHLNYFIYKQLPILSPDRYTEVDLAYVTPRVLELTYTAHDLQAWADDLAAYDPRPADQRTSPFPWNPERRAQLRAELDAYYARLYGLTRDELRYILDPADVMGADYPSETFRVLKKNEINEFGEYRTQRLVLAAWDRMAAGVNSPPLLEAEAYSPVYSEQGVIRNVHEGEFAGLIAALIRLSTEGISVSGLQDVVAHVPMAATYLESVDSTRLGILAATVGALNLSSVLTLIPPIIQRLESSGAIAKRRSGNTNLYFAGDSALPSDVLSRPEHVEIAQLMLLLEARRALVPGSQSEKAEPGPQAQGSR